MQILPYIKIGDSRRNAGNAEQFHNCEIQSTMSFLSTLGPKETICPGSSWRESEALSGWGELGKEVKDDCELATVCNDDVALSSSASTSAPGDMFAFATDAR
jgi:1-aminocyclopropane-1-carboxylate deaminase/D-cysteine desulfhydrase-like pyridoxal-dependent ACC family enzyme